MDYDDLRREIAAGEDSKRQFKVDVRNSQSLAAEIAAFANTEGGTIYIGVGDDGSLPGLESADVARINQLISNAAVQMVRSPVAVQTQNVLLANKRIVIVLMVPKGLDKPYFDNSGVIWLKSGADKRRIHSKEELRRLFQMTDQFHADEVPTLATYHDVDLLRFREFVRSVYERELPEQDEQIAGLLQNLNLAVPGGQLNLAGLLLFGEAPQRFKPQFALKAIRYPGVDPHPTTYSDSEDFEGPLSAVFEGAMAFVFRNLHKLQSSGGVNAPGMSEIPRVAVEELLVNALLHRDYLISAPIRLFLYDDRIEIVSPGHLPNNLTIENVLNGISNIRNPILASFASKGVVPYHGLGSGITRALHAWPSIAFVDDREQNQFIAVVPRPVTLSDSAHERVSGQNRSQTDPKNDLLQLLIRQPAAHYEDLSTQLGVSAATVKRLIQKLKQEGRLRRVGSRKSGRWEVIE